MIAVACPASRSKSGTLDTGGDEVRAPAPSGFHVLVAHDAAVIAQPRILAGEAAVIALVSGDEVRAPGCVHILVAAGGPQ